MGILQTLAKFFRLSKREMKILVIGLDNSGKTTIINYLKPEEKQVSYVVPTVGFNVEKVFVKPLSFTCFDMSGHTRYRNLWEHYYIECDALIFVVDSCDHLRLCVARDELEQMLEHKMLCARRIPLLIFANKMDHGCALTASKVAEALGLDQIRDKPWNIVASNGITGQGIPEGMKWICDCLKS
ncbi:ADP-ribosylation factor-like protein 6 [Paragonimus westermani]|uniref:ADP-ribosylation factor-like protein 6 n=1 Tax=Paragonimus westermani TaxID=34504 RepID=A0A5J4NSH6_9TREM|nr:ADP-ribosylation factor-like protein 6 [Paragonimus westermani]